MERNKKLSDRLLNTDEYAEELKAMMSVVEIKNIYNDFSVSLLNVRTHIKDRKDVCPICNKPKPEFPDPETGYCDTNCRIKAKALGKKIKLMTLNKFVKDAKVYKNDIEDLYKLLGRVNNLKIELPKTLPTSLVRDIEAGIDGVNKKLKEITSETNERLNSEVNNVKNKIDDKVNQSREYIVDLTNRSAQDLKNRSEKIREKRKDLVNEAYIKATMAKATLLIREIKLNIEKLIRKQLNDMFKLKSQLLKYANMLLDLGSLGLPVASIDDAINTITDNVDILKQQFDAAYDKAYGAIISFIPASINGESINFFITPKSKVWLPGPKMSNELKNLNVSISGSAMSFINWNMVDKLISNYLAELTVDDMSSDIKKFKVKYAKKIASQKNINTVKNTIKNMVMLTSQPLPKYENLKVSNPRYSLWAFTCWGSLGKLHFGMLI